MGVGYSLVVLGATWGTFEFAYNRYDAVNSFLLGVLLAPPVVRYIAGYLILVVWDSVVCVDGYNSLISGPEHLLRLVVLVITRGPCCVLKMH